MISYKFHDPWRAVCVLSSNDVSFSEAMGVLQFAINCITIENLFIMNCTTKLRLFQGPSRRFIKKPMIAAVEGYAVAGKTTVHCEIVIS